MDLSNVTRIDEFCRLCLKKDGEIPVFDKEESNGISGKIYDCVAVSICKDDKLPTVICLECSNNLDSWFTFKVRCNETQKAFTSWLRSQELTNKEVEDGVVDTCGSGKEELEVVESTSGGGLVDLTESRASPRHLTDCGGSTMSLKIEWTESLADKSEAETPSRPAIDSTVSESTLAISQSFSLDAQPIAQEHITSTVLIKKEPLSGDEEIIGPGLPAVFVKRELEEEEEYRELEPNDKFCKVCHLSFSNKGYKRHMNSKSHRSKSREQAHQAGRGKLPRNCKTNTSMDEDLAGTLPVTVGADRRLYQCDTCGFGFRSRFDLERHYQSIRHQTLVAKQNSMKADYYDTYQDSPEPYTATDSKIFACPMETCELTFSNGLLLISHMKRHGLVSNMSRDFINSTFNTGGSLKPPPGQIRCKQCKTEFRSPAGLASHMRSSHAKAHQNGVFRCKLCPASFRFIQALNAHMKSHTKGPHPQFPCKVCKKACVSLKSYQVHLRGHFLPTGSNKFFCAACLQAFDTRTAIMRHRALGKCVPMKMKIYSCNDCNHSYNKMSALEEHKAVCHKVAMAGRPYPCKLCDRSYSNIANLRRHNRTFHMKQEETPAVKYMCELCFASFTNNKSYVQHISACTLGPTKNRCVVCGKFNLTENLNVDQKCLKCSVTGSTPPASPKPQRQEDKLQVYQCPLGQKQFFARSSMLNHYSNCIGNCTNTGGYYCRFCRIKMPDFESFMAHKRGSTCIKGTVQTETVTCPKCEKVFGSSRSMRSHYARCSSSTQSAKKVKRSVEPHRCPDCNVSFKMATGLKQHKSKFQGTCATLGIFNNKFKCLICQRDLYQQQLYKHSYYCFKKFTQKQGSLNCPVCNSEYKLNDTVKDTVAKVKACVVNCLKAPKSTGEEEAKVLCYLCCYSFSSEESCKRHMVREHGKSPPVATVAPVLPIPRPVAQPVPRPAPRPTSFKKKYPCTYCSKSFYFLKHLILHKSTKHSSFRSRNIKRHKSLICKVCKRQFVSLAKLNNHEKVHGIIQENVFKEVEPDTVISGLVPEIVNVVPDLTHLSTDLPIFPDLPPQDIT